MIFPTELPQHYLFKGEKPSSIKKFKAFYTEQKDSKVYSVTELKYAKTTIQIWQDKNNYWLQIT